MTNFEIYANDAAGFDYPKVLRVSCDISEVSTKAKDFANKLGRRVAVAEFVCGEWMDVLTVGDYGCFFPTGRLKRPN